MTPDATDATDVPDPRLEGDPNDRDDVAHPDPEAVESIAADVPDERDGWERDPEDVG
jgi:hypothetical protein